MDGQPPADLRDRLHAYAEKAMREAGDHTTWTDPDEAYESAVHDAVDAVLDDAQVHGLVTGLVERLAAPGWSNALASQAGRDHRCRASATSTRAASCGSRAWSTPTTAGPSTSSPRGAAGLAHRRAGPPAAGPDDEGLAKLWVTTSALRLRRDRAGAVRRLRAARARSGSAADHVLAFDRGGAVTVATRLPVGLARHREAGATRRSRCPAGPAGATCSTAVASL